MKKGILYLVGVGSGDPELMTLKAVRIIDSCNYIAVPCLTKEESVAYNIACKVCSIDNKKCLEINMPMTTNEDELYKAHLSGASVIEEVLENGEDVAFLTLGDPSVYATTSYISMLVNEKGYESVMINGITSFTAAAALLNTQLGIKDEEIHIIPGSGNIEDAFRLNGTLVFMKIGSNRIRLKEEAKKKDWDIHVVQKCGMEGERVLHGIDALNDEIPYFSIVIVRNSFTRQFDEK